MLAQTSERLAYRALIEQRPNFRRGAGWLAFEKAVLKPALEWGLRTTGLYERGVANALDIQTAHHTLEFEDLPVQFDGFRLLHLSDLHIDGHPELAGRLCRAVEQVQADACVITGDYRYGIEGPVDNAIQGVSQLMKVLRGIPVIGTLGNHDPCEIAPRLEELGIELLVNECFVFRRGAAMLAFGGVDDSYDYQTADLHAACFEMPESAFRILLAHTPDLYAEAAEEDISLYLCGHTHGGQIRLPGVGALIHNAAKAAHRYTYGEWRYLTMKGYTSPGVGTSMLPVRFNCAPAITVLQLKRSCHRIRPARRPAEGRWVLKPSFTPA